MTDVSRNTGTMSLEAYKRIKIKMLEEDFWLHLTPEQREHLMSLKTDAAVDRYGRTLILQNMDPNY